MSVSIVSITAKSKNTFTVTISGANTVGEYGDDIWFESTPSATFSPDYLYCGSNAASSGTVTGILSSGNTVNDVSRVGVHLWDHGEETNYMIAYSSPNMSWVDYTISDPSSISYSSSINSYYSTSISWGTATTNTGKSITYTLERSTNGGSYSQVYSGTGTSYRDRLSSGTSSVAYRVKASSGSATSGYKTGSTSSVYYSVPKTVSTPGSISYVSTINAAKSVGISWGSSTTNTGSAINYYLERAINGTNSYSQIYSGTSTSYTDTGLTSSVTSVIYRVKAAASSVTSGYRTGTSSSVYYNVAPGIPASISVPSSVKVGKTLTVSWGVASDTNLSGYILERSVNGGTYTQVYKGANRSFTDTAVNGWNSILYRVKAYDAYNEMSGYKTSSAVTVTYNTEPAISGKDENLGIKTDKFSVSYIVSDPDEGQTLTVTESINGKQKRSFTTNSGVSQSFTVTEEEWVKLSNGVHTLEIAADDGNGGKIQRKYTFTKKIHEIEITLKTPIAVETMPVRGMLQIDRVIPKESDFTVEVCNNGNDANPQWEDITSAIIEKRKFFFSNKTKTDPSWAFNIRVRADRKESEGECYIQNISGSFE